jgi:hypothetical protein
VQVICYEAELLQLIHYDTNVIQNPIRPLQQLCGLQLLTVDQFYSAAGLLCAEEVLLHPHLWKYSAGVMATVVTMIVVSDLMLNFRDDCFQCCCRLFLLHFTVRRNLRTLTSRKYLTAKFSKKFAMETTFSTSWVCCIHCDVVLNHLAQCCSC